MSVETRKSFTADPFMGGSSSGRGGVESQPVRPAGPFFIRVWDNFHYMDDDEAYDHGSYATWDEALDEARRIVEASLGEAGPGADTADAIYDTYTMFGEDPSIYPEPEGMHFSAWDYARQRSIELADQRANADRCGPR